MDRFGGPFSFVDLKMKKISLWTGLPPDHFYCPCCGNDVFDNPCTHLMYVYSAAECTFAHVADHFQTYLDDVIDRRMKERDANIEEPLSIDGFFNFDVEDDLEKYPDSHTRFMFQLEYIGNACGENLSCSYVGFDLSR